MNYEEKIKLFRTVFAPKSGEKILFIMDEPSDKIADSDIWKDRRRMTFDWFTSFQEMGAKEGFFVDIIQYKATGMHNAPIPNNVIEEMKKSNLVIAITEFSASSSLFPISRAKNSQTRCASLPMVEKRMEKTAFKADYKQVQRYAKVLKKMLENAVGADVDFSTGDHLYIDLRYRPASLEAGDCTQPGQFINFPSGEAWQPPYEGVGDEVKKYGKSQTAGIMPVSYDGKLVKFVIENNRIVEIHGDKEKAADMQRFFDENKSRRNIAELGLGCNPNAVVTGNGLEDEKVGLHIAYGQSSHFGGKVDCDMHLDIIYVKGCPVEGTTLTLKNKDGTETELIRDAELRYELLG